MLYILTNVHKPEHYMLDIHTYIHNTLYCTNIYNNFDFKRFNEKSKKYNKSIKI